MNIENWWGYLVIPVPDKFIRGQAPAGIFWYMRMERNPCVYILASKANGTLYIGVTSDLIKRVWEHKNNVVDGFTKKYHVHMLVWYEQHVEMESAIVREKRLKKWNRDWKIQLINQMNPQWRDLYPDIV